MNPLVKPFLFAHCQTRLFDTKVGTGRLTVATSAAPFRLGVAIYRCSRRLQLGLRFGRCQQRCSGKDQKYLHWPVGHLRISRVAGARVTQPRPLRAPRRVPAGWNRRIAAAEPTLHREASLRNGRGRADLHHDPESPTQPKTEHISADQLPFFVFRLHPWGGPCAPVDSMLDIAEGV